MNTGFGDAVDLGWELEAVLRGWGGGALLGSYDNERRPIGVRNVAEATSNFRNLRDLPTYPWIEKEGPAADQKREVLGEHFREMTRKEWQSYGVQLGYHYEGSPLLVPDGTAPPIDDPSNYVQTARPGSRAPHAWISPGHSMLDLFGRGVVLLDFGAETGAVDALHRAAQIARIPLAIHRADLPEIARLYERNLCWFGRTGTSLGVMTICRKAWGRYLDELRGMLM